jgi:hypothetical protein
MLPLVGRLTGCDPSTQDCGALPHDALFWLVAVVVIVLAIVAGIILLWDMFTWKSPAAGGQRAPGRRSRPDPQPPPAPRPVQTPPPF